MRHAPVAAARVLFAPSVAAARKAVAREYEQVLQPLVALPRRGHRRYRRAGPPVARRDPAARGEPVAAREVGYVYGYDQLGCRARSYAGHRVQAPVRLVAASSADISEVGDPVSAAFSDILRASSRTARSSQATAAGCGLLNDSTDSASAATLARLQPRVSAPTDCDEASDIGYGQPAAAMSSRVAGSERSACASNSGHDSSNMLWSLFLLRVFSQVKKSLCAASDLAASISGGLSATASGASVCPAPSWL